MQKLIYKSEGSSFAKSTLKILSGKVFGQIITVLTLPIISRLYSPDHYGVYQFLLSLSAIIISISSLRYDFAIMLPKDDKDATNIVALCMIIVFSISVISGVVSFFLKTEIIELSRIPELANFLWLLPIFIFTDGIFNVVQYWTMRNKEFGRSAIAQASSSMIGAGYKIGVGVFGKAGPAGLIGSHVILSLSGTLILFYKSIIKNFKHFIESISLSRIQNMAKRYKSFPIFSTWSGLFNYATTNLPVFLLAYYFDSATVGLYTFALSSTKAPMRFIAESIGRVFFQKASEDKNALKQIDRLSIAVFRRLVAFGMLPTISLILFGKELFSFVFSESWTQSGYLMQWMAPWLFFQVVATPMKTIFSIEERQMESLLIHGVLLLCNLGALILGGMSGSIEATIILLSLINTVLVSTLTFRSLSIVGVSVSKLLRILLIHFLYCIPIVIISLIIDYFQLGLQYVFIALTVFLGYYLAIIIVKDKLLKSIVLGLIGRIHQK